MIQFHVRKLDQGINQIWKQKLISALAEFINKNQN